MFSHAHLLSEDSTWRTLLFVVAGVGDCWVRPQREREREEERGGEERVRMHGERGRREKERGEGERKEEEGEGKEREGEIGE